MTDKIQEAFEREFSFSETDETLHQIAYTGSYSAFEMGWKACEAEVIKYLEEQFKSSDEVLDAIRRRLS